jgi:hypothetical protein
MVHSEYGVEYVAIMNDNSILIIFPIKIFGERLLESKYYTECKKNYERNKFKERRQRIDSIDIELTNNEKNYIEYILKHTNDKIKDHGFYDVCYVPSTLNLEFPHP